MTLVRISVVFGLPGVIFNQFLQWTARRKRKYQGSNLARERDGKRPSHVPGSSGGDVSDSDYEQRASSSPRAGKRVKSEDDSDYGVKKVS